LECGDWSPLSPVDLLPHRAACRPESLGRLGARPHSGSWHSRQQAAWSCRQEDLQSGDQSPHSKRPLAPCSVTRIRGQVNSIGARTGSRHQFWLQCPGRRRPRSPPSHDHSSHRDLLHDRLRLLIGNQISIHHPFYPRLERFPRRNPHFAGRL